MEKNTNIPGANFQNYLCQCQTGAYKCLVSNNADPLLPNPIAVTVNQLPAVAVSQDPCSGAAVLLHAAANPATGITYQWKKDQSLFRAQPVLLIVP